MKNWIRTWGKTARAFGTACRLAILTLAGAISRSVDDQGTGNAITISRVRGITRRIAAAVLALTAGFLLGVGPGFAQTTNDNVVAMLINAPENTYKVRGDDYDALPPGSDNSAGVAEDERYQYWQVRKPVEGIFVNGISMDAFPVGLSHIYWEEKDFSHGCKAFGEHFTCTLSVIDDNVHRAINSRNDDSATRPIGENGRILLAAVQRQNVISDERPALGDSDVLNAESTDLSVKTAGIAVEPNLLSMLLAGVGLIGLVAYRRQVSFDSA